MSVPSWYESLGPLHKVNAVLCEWAHLQAHSICLLDFFWYPRILGFEILSSKLAQKQCTRCVPSNHCSRYLLPYSGSHVDLQCEASVFAKIAATCEKHVAAWIEAVRSSSLKWSSFTTGVPSFTGFVRFSRAGTACCISNSAPSMMLLSSLWDLCGFCSLLINSIASQLWSTGCLSRSPLHMYNIL